MKLELGAEFLGHVDGTAVDLAAMLKLDARGALLSIPRVDSGFGLFSAFADEDGQATEPYLRLQTASGLIHLSECRSAGGTASSRGYGVTKVRALRAIHGGDEVADYGEVDGMTSEIDGLSTWTGMSAVTQTFELVDDQFNALVIRAQNKESIVLGGDANAEVDSSFHHHPQPKNNVFGITDVALLRTRSSELWSWSRHAAVHHMFQDLMCLVYGQPCLSRVKSVKREDDQPYVTVEDQRRTWRDAYEPTFGRDCDGIESLDRAKAVPLFQWQDVEPANLESWMNEWQLWSRPTWIAVTTMFQRGTTVEARLLQVGVALEALGFAIWTAGLPEGSTERAPSYPELLELVTRTVSLEHKALYGEDESRDWRRKFNAAFKGSKHADQPLPDGSEALRLSVQAMNLVRTWLGGRLGVSEEQLRQGLDRVRES